MMHQVISTPWRQFCLYLTVLLLTVCSANAAQPTAFDNWAKTAKIGGASLYVGISQQEINTILDTLVSQHVTVVEADSDLSNYQTDAQFELELDLMRQFADESHKRGLRVVWYIPALEVITPNGKNIPNTMAKEHPDWLQVGLNGQPNVFYGGGGQVFWVEADAESAWMSPSSTGYREYFFNRIKQMTDTGIDGIWADVPIYADFGSTKWSDFNPEAIAKFEADTGYDIPTAEDWNDPAWRRWIHWRHEELARFLNDLTNISRESNPEFAIFAEVLPTDYNGGTIYGLDAGLLKSTEGLTAIWEIDTMSNSVGMRKARTDDWISFISALKYARGATGEKPSWTFTYGKQADDAQQVMTQAMIAGNNPYELQVPEMATTVGDAYRSRMFNWSKVNAPYLFKAKSTAKTGILFSSSSRDYVDQFQGLGMFATTDGGSDDLWWSESYLDSVYERDYLGEFRGVLKILVNEHIPFNVLVVPDQAELNQYQTVFMPNTQAISDAEAQRLRSYVQQGGQLIVTGPNPTGLNEFGLFRSNYALADLLGFNKWESLPTSKVQSFGAGKTHFYASPLGKQYLTSGSSSARNTITNKVRSLSTIQVSTNADDRVYVETARLDKQAVIQFTNFIGLNGNFSVVPTNISVTYTVPDGEFVSSVALSNPDTSNTATTNVPFSRSGSQISFNIPLTQYAMVIVSFNGAQSPDINILPSAGDDNFQTDINTPLNFTAGQLLANDGDLNGNSLNIQNVLAFTSTNGVVSDLGGGNYRYTPNTGFSGLDRLTYTVGDGQGGQDIALIKILVAPSTSYYYPDSVTRLIGFEDTQTLTEFRLIDGLTYDVISDDAGGNKVVDWYATTTIQEDVSDIASIKVRHLGHYSLNGVSQRAYLYNYQTNDWELFDSATVGEEANHPAVKTISSNIGAYISSNKQMRLRVRGERANGNLTSWSEQLFWAVTPVIDDTQAPYPVGNPDNASTNNGNTITIDVLANDVGNGLTLIAPNTWSLKGGRVYLVANKLSYTPKTGFNGQDKIWYSFTDSQGRGNWGEVTINVTDGGTVNPVPVGNPDTASSAGATISIDVLANDIGNGLVILAPNPWSLRGGRVALQGNKIEYTPKIGFSGEDKIWYTFRDVENRESWGEVTITVTSDNNPPPVGTPDFVSVSAGGTLTIDVLANDIGNGLVLDPLSSAYSLRGGSVAVSNNKLIYQPKSGFIGEDKIWYTFSEVQGRSNWSEVTIDVMP